MKGLTRSQCARTGGTLVVVTLAVNTTMKASVAKGEVDISLVLGLLLDCRIDVHERDAKAHVRAIFGVLVQKELDESDYNLFAVIGLLKSCRNREPRRSTTTMLSFDAVVILLYVGLCSIRAIRLIFTLASS